MRRGLRIAVSVVVVVLLLLTGIAVMVPRTDKATDEDEPLLPPPLEDINPRPKPSSSIGGYTAPMVPWPGTWATKASSPVKRCDTPNGAVGHDLNDAIYHFGGEDYSTNYVENYKYDGQGNQWTQRASMITGPREEFGIAAYNGMLYAFGGHPWTLGGQYTTLSRNEMYDPATDQWTAKANMPHGRTWPAAAFANNKIYVSGGWDLGSGGMLNYNEEYDPVGDTWATKTPDPVVRKWHSAAAVNGKIYFIGGGDSSNNIIGTNEEYDPVQDTWTTKASMPTPRMGFACCILNNLIYCIGGGLTSFQSTNVNEVYDPSLDTWATDTPMPTARQEVGASTIGNKIYVIGGWNGGNPCLDINEEFTPATPPTLYVTVNANPNVVNSGGTSDITVHVTDGTSPMAGCTVAVTDYGAGGSFTIVTDQGNGDYTTTYTAPIVTSQLLVAIKADATKGGYVSGTGSTTITVNPILQQLNVTVNANPNSVQSGGTSTITVHVSVGATGITGCAVQLDDGSAGGSFTSVQDVGSGDYTSTYTAPTVTSQTLVTITANATKTGYNQGQNTTQITVNPITPTLHVTVNANPKTVFSGGTSTITVHVTDGSTPMTGCTIQLDDGSVGGSFTSVQEMGNGDYQSTYTAPTVTTPKVVTITAKASKGGYNDGQGTTTITVNPIPPKVLAVTVSANPATVYSSGTTNITVHVTDGSNPVTGCSILLDDGSAGGSFSSVSDQGNGDYKSAYTAPTVTSQKTVTVTGNASKATYTSNEGSCTVTVNPPPPKDLIGAVTANPGSVLSNRRSTVTVHITDGAMTVSGVTVSLAVSGGGSFSPGSGTTDPNGDFQSVYTAPSVTSQRQCTITATYAKTGYNGGYNHTTVTVIPLPDLAIASGNITFSKLDPVKGDSVTITAKVNNLGGSDADNVLVRFLDGSNTIGEKTVTKISQGAVQNVAVSWSVNSEGAHTIKVLADPDNAISERDESNNNATRDITVSSPGNGNNGNNTNGNGTANGTGDFGGFPIWGWALVALIPLFLIMLLILLVLKRRKKEEEEKKNKRLKAQWVQAPPSAMLAPPPPPALPPGPPSPAGGYGGYQDYPPQYGEGYQEYPPQYPPYQGY